MTLLRLQRGIVYGPVRSRRLGRSLGINLLPAGTKVCNFDCVYCQYGWSDLELLRQPDALAFPSVDEVLAAVETELETCAEPPACLTFSGNGEPTLHPRFPEVVDGVVRVRDRLAPAARTVVLSNSTRAADPAVRAALSRLDLRIMKLDAGGEELLRRYNRPAPGIDLLGIVEGLSALGGVTLQSLFTAGPGGNAKASSVSDWLEQVRIVQPVGVQVYTLDRGYPSRRIEPLPPEELEAISRRVREAGFAAEVF